jgi:hypothetical protein
LGTWRATRFQPTVSRKLSRITPAIIANVSHRAQPDCGGIAPRADDEQERDRDE